MKKLTAIYMSTLNNWLRVNYRLIVILLLVILLILLVSDLYMRSNRHFDDNRFNNIVTPSAAIISIVLFAFLTYQQLRLQQSGNLKQNFEDSFHQLESELSSPITERIAMIIGIPTSGPSYVIPDINSLNYCSAIHKALDRISMDSEFIVDHTDFLSNNSIRIPHSYLRKRTYFRDLEFVLAFAFYPTFKYQLIENFLDQINASKLVKPDQIHFKRKVEAEFLYDYFQLVIHRGSFELPDFHVQDPQGVLWQSYRSAGMDRFFLPFREKLTH